jgi:hypothetical protein
MNAESINGEDVVLCYAGHFLHADGDAATIGPRVIGGSHVVGPTLTPQNW